jgi:3-oxoadipate CoA-transferase alpha subunit
MTARTYGPIMAVAATIAVASVLDLVELGNPDPEAVVTPGLFVQRVAKVPRTAAMVVDHGQAAPR